MSRFAMLILLLAVIGLVPLGRSTADLRVASKMFTESVILGELLTGLARSDGIDASHVPELGGTRLVYEALRKGDVDLYPEYTGTIRQEILAGDDPVESLDAALAKDGIAISRPLGFNNTYAIGMQRSRAAELGLESLSDLRKHPGLRFGFSNEFMDRGDGWPNLRETYSLPQRDVRGLDHDIAFRQLAAGSLDVIDVYSTEAKIAEYDLKLLDDDRSYFPRYDAVVLYRSEVGRRFPSLITRVNDLSGRMTESEMIALNRQVDAGEMSEAQAAASWLQRHFQIDVAIQEPSMLEQVWQRTVEHLDLVRRSLIPAVFVAIPLGVLCFKWRRPGHIILATVGLVQTIPALALLVLLIPVVSELGLNSLGTGSPTAIIALFLYSLLPIVRNTHSGLEQIAPGYADSAIALGLKPSARLLKVELPLASPSILTGIKTAAVLNVGFATLGALIGAGGFGQPILTGIRLNNTNLILQGAVPAALLALILQALFEVVERVVVPLGLRLKPQA